MHSFDMIVVGCGGGPSELNLSSYFIKASNVPWDAGIVALDAGSGVGALDLLLQRSPDKFSRQDGQGDVNSSFSGAEVYSWIRCFLITHAHLDHVLGLVLSAGSLQGPPRQILGVDHTLNAMEKGLFSDHVWPKLASWKEGDALPLVFKSLPADGEYTTVSRDISVRTMPISHGQNATMGTYECAAFFIRHDPSAHEFLFFGDVEPDSVADKPMNVHVWRAAASKIPHVLSTIFIECSWPSGRHDDMLYGHLNPEHLAAELSVLAAEVVNARQRAADAQDGDGRSHARKKQRMKSGTPPAVRRPLNGVRVYITHCKDDTGRVYDRPINEVITDQVRTLVETKELGAEIIAVDQGMHISI